MPDMVIRNLPVALLIALGVQFASAVWFGASLRAEVTTLAEWRRENVSLLQAQQITLNSLIREIAELRGQVAAMQRDNRRAEIVQ